VTHPLFTLQVVLDVSAVIGFAMFAWWALEAKSALRATLVSNRMLCRALAQADLDAQARGYE
jgi:hypothetical protein